MSKKHIPAKDLAFERERMEWRQERREYERELKSMRSHIAELDREIEQRNDLLRSKDEWIERLLEFTELSRDEVKTIVEKSKSSRTAINSLSGAMLGLFGHLSPFMSMFAADGNDSASISVPLTDGVTLTANVEEYAEDTTKKQMSICIETDKGNVVQDIAIVKPHEHDGKGGVRLLVFSDVYDEDYTHTFDIDVYEEVDS